MEKAKNTWFELKINSAFEGIISIKIREMRREMIMRDKFRISEI
jgi:hypothetical protein